MGILPGLFLFKQPSYLVNPPSSSYRSSEIYNKSNTACHQRRLSERFSRCLLSTSAPLVPDHRYFAYRTDVGGRGGTIGGEDTTAPMRLHLPNDPQSFSRGSIGRPLSRETVDVALFRATVSRFPTDFLRSVDCSRYVTLRLVSSCPGRSEVSRKKIVCRKREEPRRRSRQRVAMFPRHGDQTRLVLRWVKVIPLVAESEINATHRRDWLPNARRNMQMSRPARASSKRGREWKIPTFFLSLSLSLSLPLPLSLSFSLPLALSRPARVAFRFVLSRISRAGPATIAARGRSEEQRSWRNETKKEEPMRRYNATPYVFLLLFDFFSLPVSPSYTPTLPTDK